MTAPSEAKTLTITLTPELATALDRYMAESNAEQSHALAVTQVVREWAMSKGYLDGSDEGLRPDQLNAANDD
ncbi:hypothetical protein JYU29_05335 [Tianweitania sp. BSSL-BM11]|uniref:CopG family transcriptional regulator n=1 Tax=Tianweitania aestuarii TaxID=2814886 RepID=A0ABS5RTG7_9HYPH|nr:hypothetical protein [Tianweitania aestuarii]MBS9720110.1 hypothetical protein [Tianweitania aestuarii]